MTVNLLILGGTTEARQLGRTVAQSGMRGTLSLAGRVDRPLSQALPTRTGGFGGVEGLASYLREEAVTHLVDATHPFAAQMSRNASDAALLAGVRFAALTRPPWERGPGDNWHVVPDIAAAVAQLDGSPRRIFLAIGRQSLAPFAAQPQHHYLLRLVDPPEVPPPLPDHTLVLDRGPFTYEADRALLEKHHIDCVISKNSGGDAARAKLDVARDLGLPVIMIARPRMPIRREFTDPRDVVAWASEGRVLRD